MPLMRPPGLQSPVTPALPAYTPPRAPINAVIGSGVANPQASARPIVSTPAGTMNTNFPARIGGLGRPGAPAMSGIPLNPIGRPNGY